jgi:hypothetical protein
MSAALQRPLRGIQRALEEKRDNFYCSASAPTPNATRRQAESLRRGVQSGCETLAPSDGSQKSIAEVWKSFVNVKDHGNGQIQHTNLATLIDAKAWRVDYYGDKWLVKEVLKDIKWLESEKS